MTMPTDFHPDDERLAAYAGADRDAVSDRALVEHLAACDRCRPIVDELTSLTGALAALPDLVPSRPLRLIPPVPAAPRQPAPLPWLRRLLAPAMFGGAALVLVGAVGMSGVGARVYDASSVRTSMGAATASDQELAPGAGAVESVRLSPLTNPEITGRSNSPSPAEDNAFGSEPSSSPGDDAELLSFGDRDGEQPWLTLLIAGAAIFTVSTVLRFTVVPRAG